MGVFKRIRKLNGKKSEYWYIDYTINGKRKWESVGKVGLVSKSDAKKLLELRNTEVLKGKFGNSKKKVIPTFVQFAKEYIEYAKGNKKSWDRDECALRVLAPFFGKYILNEINPFLVEKYKIERKKTVSDRTINIELSLLRRMFNLAISWDKSDSNPINKVKFYKEELSKERILSEKEESTLLNSSPDHIKPILLTALNTGMRYGEIINLKWKDIDFESSYIHITKSKTGKDRKIPVNDILYRTLKKQKSEIFVSKSVSHTVNLSNKSQYGRVVKLADTTASKAVGLTSVGVQVPPRPDPQTTGVCKFHDCLRAANISSSSFINTLPGRV